MERIRKHRVHRFIIVDDDEALVGLVWFASHILYKVAEFNIFS
jgi:hypothetical protein